MKKPMIGAYALFSGVSIVSFLSLGWLELCAGFGVVDAYAKIQGSLFTGFLTIGGFLLSLKAFLLLRLKQDIYDHQGYLEQFEEMKALDGSMTRYGPLGELSKLLVVTVLCALCSSVSHLILGYIAKPYGPLVAISLSFATLALVLLCWFQLSANLKSWMKFIEKHPAKPAKPEGQTTGAREGGEQHKQASTTKPRGRRRSR